MMRFFRKMMAVLLLCALALPTAGRALTSYSGTWGTCAWEMDDAGILIVQAGNAGSVAEAPWKKSGYVGANVASIRLESGVVLPANCRRLFENLFSCETIDLSNADASRVTEISELFMNCSYLRRADLSVFSSSKISGMTRLFFGCGLLESVNLKGLNTSRVTNMSHVFELCKSLKQVDVSGFDTQYVTDMTSMFADCAALTALDLSAFKTPRLTGMNAMFKNCSALKTLKLPGFSTSAVTEMKEVFSGCEKLQSLDLRSFETAKVSSFEDMFYNCAALKTLNGALDLSGATFLMRMFSGCASLQAINTSGFNLYNGKFLNEMFKDCASLTRLDLSQVNAANIGNMGLMFYGCSRLDRLDLGQFVNKESTYADQMFDGCDSLSRIKVGAGFHFSSSLCLLPDGPWRSESTGATYTAGEIAETRSGIGDVYTHMAAPAYGAVVIPASAKSIASQAFRGIDAIYVELPPNLSNIAADAFDSGIIFIVKNGSASQRWAQSHGYTWVCR